MVKKLDNCSLRYTVLYEIQSIYLTLFLLRLQNHKRLEKKITSAITFLEDKNMPTFAAGLKKVLSGIN